MADNIYRKSTLDRMSSPEQLDKMIVITSPSFWLALAGGLLIVVVALIWAIAGRLPVKVETTGIFVTNQKEYTLSSETGGIVSSIEVKEGDTVEKGQVIIKLIDGNSIQQEALNLDEGIQNVESVTMENGYDEITITADMSGTVSEIKVRVGDVVGQGTEIVTVCSCVENTEEDDEDIVVCYVPITQGKKIKEGMSVNIYPSTVNQQEYGHMEAEVISVDEYVASTTSMQSILGDDMLVQTFLQSGPVVGVVCKLKKDDSTASGYYWSSKKGADVQITQGTLVSADIVVDEKRPISMVIPMLKEKLSMVSDSAESAGSGGAQ